MLLYDGDGMVEYDRHRCLEWTCLPERRGKYDEQVEEDAEGCKGGDDCRDRPTETPQILSQCVPEKEKRELHDEGETLHNDPKAPGDHPPHPELPVATAVNERSVHVEIEPLFPKRGQERGEKCARQRSEHDRLNLDRGRIWTRLHWDFEVVRNTRGGVEQHCQDGETHLGVIGTQFLLDIDDECGRHGGEQTSLVTRQPGD